MLSIATSIPIFNGAKVYGVAFESSPNIGIAYGLTSSFPFGHNNAYPVAIHSYPTANYG